MADTVDPKRRSEIMGRIRSKNTAPEMAVRRAAHSLGYRFRIHRRDLPGRPDLVLPGRSAAIFVHGCFWHRHQGCQDCSEPKTRREYWEPKFAGNVARDAAAQAQLKEAGWRVLVIWDCETRNRGMLESKLIAFLGPAGGRCRRSASADSVQAGATNGGGGNERG